MFAIAPYLVEIKDSYNNTQDLWNFNNGNTLHNVLHDYYASNFRNYQSSLSQNQQLFMVSSMYEGTTTSVSGTYQTGQFGFESEIYSTKRRRVSYKRGTEEADMRPFHFSFYLPKDRNPAQQKRGLLILSRFNTLGVRHQTIPHLQHYFALRFPTFKLEFGRVVPRVVMETIMKEGSVKTIRLIRKSIPSDIADALSVADLKKVQEVELVIRSKRRSPFKEIDVIKNIVNRRIRPSEIFVVDSFKHDNVKLEVEMDGKSRIVDLGNLSKLSSNIELQLEPGPDGHPPIADWLSEVDALASDMAKSWGMQDQQWTSSPKVRKGGENVRQTESAQHN